MSRFGAPLAAVFLLLLAGCSPAREAAAPGRDGVAPQAIAQAGAVDTACASDAECAIKDVGSCCGYFPACVNVDSPTFPDKVRADCAAEGRAGICGFPALRGCQCVQGRCEGITGPGAATDLR